MIQLIRDAYREEGLLFTLFAIPLFTYQAVYEWIKYN